jgi:O-antigen/teichoic acid export membrane protein
LIDLKQKALKGVFWSGAQMWGGRAISFIIFAMLSHLLTPQAFGLVAMASLFIIFVQTFQDQGFGDAIVQRADLQPEHLDTAFWTNMLMGSLLALISFILSGFIAELFRQPQLTPIIRWLSLSFIFAALSSTQQAILRRKLAFRELAIRSLLAITAGGVIGVALAFLGFGVWSLVAQDLVYGVVEVVVLWRVSRWRPGLRFSTKHFRDLFSFGINIIGINILNFINGHVDDLLIGYFLGPTLLGFYTVAYKLLGTMLDLFTSVTNSVAFPTFSRLQNEPDRLRRAFYQAIHYTSLISFPAFIGMAAVAPELIPVLFGPQWTLSIPVLRVLAFIGILQSIFYFHNSLVIALGKPSWRLRMVLLNAVLNVIGFAFAVQYGIVAVAVSYVVRGYLVSPIEFWMVHKLAQINLRTYLYQFLGPSLGTLAMTATILVIAYLTGNETSIQLQLALFVLSGGLVYLIIVQLVEPSLYRQLLSLVRLVLPARLFPRVQDS